MTNAEDEQEGTLRQRFADMLVTAEKDWATRTTVNDIVRSAGLPSMPLLDVIRAVIGGARNEDGDKIIDAYAAHLGASEP